LWRVHGRLFGTDRLLSLLLRRLLRVGAGWLLLWLSSTDWETGWLRTKRKVSDEIALWRVHGRLFGTDRLLSLLLRRLLRVSAGWLLLWLSSTDWETGWLRTKRKVSDEIALWRVSREAVRYRQAVEPAVATVVESQRRLAAAVVELHRLGNRLASDEAESQ
jgi:hypothetical protein